MIIYKITNQINGKIYIGQTINTLEKRFNRHKQDALSGRLDTHFARALREYGVDNFIAEVIENVNSQEELNIREHYWINYYNSCKEGYNETNSILKSGGNTYQSKTTEEMEIIKAKIRETKIGGKNPASKKVKCKNIKTNQELHFNSLSEMQQYFKEENHNFITRRCNHTIKCLYKQEWLIAYEEDEYDTTLTAYKNNARAKQIKVTNIQTKEENIFPSYSAAEKYFNLSRGCLSYASKKQINNQFSYQHYNIIIL